MTAKRGGLGRNLSVLLSGSPTALTAEDKPIERLNLSVDCLQPGKYQPRTEIEEQPLAELAESIKQQGLIQPLVVREIAEGSYEIIAGERRWRASQLAGLKEVPVVIRQVDDESAMAIALIENIQREDLNAMDEARAMHRLCNEFQLTHQQVADVLGKSRTAVSNYLRLLGLHAKVKQFVEHGDLDMGHARALLMLDEEQQPEVAELIVAKHLSVRETEKLVARVKEGKIAKKEAAKFKPNPDVQDKLAQLALQLKTKIKLKESKEGQGTLVINYNSRDALLAIMEQLGK